MVGDIGCVVIVDFKIINVLIANEDLSVVDIGRTNEGATVPLSARVLAVVTFRRGNCLLISKVSALCIVYKSK